MRLNVDATIWREDVSLRDDHYVVRLETFKLRDQWAMIGALVVVTLIAISLQRHMFRSRSVSESTSIDERIKQLDSMQKSLQDLDSYISARRAGLRELTQDVVRLQRERDTLARAAALNREQVEALLSFQSAEQRRQQ